MNGYDSSLTLHPPIGKEFILRGIAKGAPSLNPGRLEYLTKLAGANPLKTGEIDTPSERIWYVLQSESHLCVRYDKSTKEVRLDDFTCGPRADPTNLSPTKNPEVAEILGLVRFRDNAKNPIKRGERSLNPTKDYGIHFVSDIFGGNSRKLNDFGKLEQTALLLGREIVGEDVPLKGFHYEFIDSEGSPDGYSGMYVFSGESNGRPNTAVVSFHTYPKEGVWMGDINSKNLSFFYRVPEFLKGAFEGKAKNWKVLPVNYLA